MAMEWSMSSTKRIESRQHPRSSGSLPPAFPTCFCLQDKNPMDHFRIGHSKELGLQNIRQVSRGSIQGVVGLEVLSGNSGRRGLFGKRCSLKEKLKS